MNEKISIKLEPGFLNIIDVFSRVNEPAQRLQHADTSLDNARHIDLFYTLAWINSPKGDTIMIENAREFYGQDRELISEHCEQYENIITRRGILLELNDVIGYWEDVESDMKLKELLKLNDSENN